LSWSQFAGQPFGSATAAAAAAAAGT
jgi:hypothetical protein